MESLIPVISGLAQMLALAIIVLELLANRRLHSRVVRVALFNRLDTVKLPKLPPEVSPEVQSYRAVRYRWDANAQVLLFGRSAAVLSGEFGTVVGVVRWTKTGPILTWRPGLLTLFPVFFGLGSLGLGYFALVEGDWIALAGVPLLAIACAVMYGFSWINARGVLLRAVLPDLKEALADP